MPEFPVQSEGVDVEQIMEQIRARIRANRDSGDAAPDAQARAAAAPQPASRRGSARAHAPQPAAEPELPPAESFDFDHDTIYRSSRGALGSALYAIRRLLSPLLKFVFNVQTMTHALAVQSRINRRQAAFDDRVSRLFETSSQRLEAREEIDKLNQQVMQDLVAEMTRLSVEMKNHRMFVESVAARLDFFERQAQARKVDGRARSGSQPAERSAAAEDGGESTEPARRRRRRGRRRSGRGGASATTTTAETDSAAAAEEGAAATSGGEAPEAGESSDSSAAGAEPATESSPPEPAPDAGAPQPETKPPDS